MGPGRLADVPERVAARVAVTVRVRLRTHADAVQHHRHEERHGGGVGGWAFGRMWDGKRSGFEKLIAER